MMHACSVGTHGRPMSYNDLRRGRRSTEGQVYLVTAATLHRQPFFSNFAVACIAARAIAQSGRNGDWLLIAWVIMPDHVHLLVQLGQCRLGQAVGRLKGRSSRAIGLAMQGSGPVWQPGFHDRALRREESVEVVARYICANPLRAGIVASLRDYPFWDAVAFEDIVPD